MENDILNQINALTKVIEVNRGFFGDEDLVEQCNKKIKELIKQL